MTLSYALLTHVCVCTNYVCARLQFKSTLDSMMLASMYAMTKDMLACVSCMQERMWIKRRSHAQKTEEQRDAYAPICPSIADDT